ncbi:hypothetical protein OG21DRAFT_135893 [Imleria badia]|nr:hypothetical protein OG21DRAFT_135893 [Imleria badia]
MGTPYQQIQPAPAVVVPDFPSFPSDLALQPTVSGFSPPQVPPTRRKPRGDRSVTSSPYHPTRTSSLPVQSVSRKETGTCCQWVKEDGAVCGAHITLETVPQHLRTHDIENMAHNCLVSCRWLGCRLRGDKAKIKRESIARHVREIHLGSRRTL